MKEKYASVHQYYQIMVRDNEKGTATGLVFEKKAEAPMEGKAGIYFLKTVNTDHIYNPSNFPNFT